MKQLPIGLQTFEDLRKGNGIYVDKTKEIYKMLKELTKFYFLSRPRRFGKSLLISTLKELFKGNKEIFEGLYIYDKWDWSKQYPVIHLDFTELAYDSPERLKNSLSDFITKTAIEYSIELISSEIESRFAEVIEKLHKSRGEQVVMLIDEYDKPMIDSLNKAKEVHQEIKETLHNFYQVIKGSDEHIKFMFMTGVSKFSGLSIFSALNNLNDITMNNKYVSICGYTQEELEGNFKEHIESTAESMGKSKEELLREIKYWYNGYSWDGKVSVYNPFSTLKFFDNKKFQGYWFETGTPTFLIEQVEKMGEVESLVGVQKVSAEVLKGPDNEEMEPISLMFQTGYLTVMKEEIEERELVYSIDFPNYEVRKAFLTRLVAVCARKTQKDTEGIRKKIKEAIKKEEGEKLEESLVELYANIPYDLHIGKEKYYHSLFLLTMKLIEYEVEGEVHTDKGRIDVVLRREKEVIVVEIKYGENKQVKKMLEEAMKQIRDKKYYEKYMGKEVSLLAVAFGQNKEIICKFAKI
jgi:ERCC4-type nuclease